MQNLDTWPGAFGPFVGTTLSTWGRAGALPSEPAVTVATVEQVGRLPGGQAGALFVRHQARWSASGRPAPARVVVRRGRPASVASTVLELAREYKGLVTTILHQRGAVQVVDGVAQITDPSQLADTAGHAPYLSDAQELSLLETVDVAQRLRAVVGLAREHLAELDVAETTRRRGGRAARAGRDVHPAGRGPR